MLNPNRTLKIETAHLPQLEAEFIEHILDTTDIALTVECAVDESPGGVGEACASLQDYLADEFAELESEVEDEIDGERTADADEYLTTSRGHLAACWTVTVTETVERQDEPDYETVAIRLLGAWIEHVNDGLMNFHRLFPVAP